MALQKSLTCDRSVISRIGRSGSTAKQGIGHDDHLTVGPTTSYRHRAFVRFNMASSVFADVKKVIKAELVLRTDTNNAQHFGAGSVPQVKIRQNGANWTEQAGDGEGDWSSAGYEWPASRGSDVSLTAIPVQDNLTVFLDVTKYIGNLLPKNVLDADGNPGKALANYGFKLYASDDETSTRRRIVFGSRHHNTAGVRPTLLLTYDPVNRPPAAPTLTSPPTGDVTFDTAFEGTHNDPDLDPMERKAIWVGLPGQNPLNSGPLTGQVVGPGIPAKTVEAIWRLDEAASPSEVSAGVFSVPLTRAVGSLKSQTDYVWSAATRDPSGRWGPWAANRTLRISSLPPAVVATDLGDLTTLAGVKFGGSYSDPESDPLASYHIQLRAPTASGDPAWETGPHFWDTGEVLATAPETAANRVQKEYGGRALAAGDYAYRVSVRDVTGVWSAWDYATLTLLNEYTSDPGDIDLVTSVDRDAPVRIALWHLDETTRGPGALIGYIEDPVNLGASKYMNAGGELYFSLPALHPYCPELEPWRVHYAVEQWHGDRYKPIFQGLITDFDATPDEATFYGIDYLGLYQLCVDERYNPAKSSEPPPAGSKYTDKTLSFVINEQLTYHKARANSIVKFIDVGTISALAERVTIYSTYTEALPFMSGLIDSHKQGTGRECRLYVREKVAAGGARTNTFEVLLSDNWGVDRPNIRLEYGQLINDFRVVALGDFGTRVLGIGQKRGEVAVYRELGASGLDEAEWGAIAKTRFWPEIVDVQDLKRRVKEAASQISKVGKRMALALRADSLNPFDGWDIGDSINIAILRGVVDTDRYGSEGYWTVWGVEFRYYPDGHQDMTLTVLPKKSDTPPDPDLIPSQPPAFSPEWQVGYGVPGDYGEPPAPTPPPGGSLLAAKGGEEVTTFDLPLSDDPVNAKFYEDLNTGCVYELDETTLTYVEVYCPETGGGGTPTPIDTTPPAIPEVLDLATELVTQEDGDTAAGLVITVGYASPPVGLTDLQEYIFQSTRYTIGDTGEPDWALATQWVAAAADATGTLPTTVVQSPVLSALPYWVRVAAIDVIGNRSGWSDPEGIVSAADNEGPDQPSGIVVTPGMSAIGVRWDNILVQDLAYVEVQWRESPSGPWVSAHVPGTMTVITGVTNDIPYDIRLRSVDTSGNTLDNTTTPPADPVYVTVKVDEDPEAGWVDAGTVTPSTLPGNALVWDEAVIEDIFAGMLSADWIVTGTLRVGGTGDATDTAIEVYNAEGELIGRWSTAGIEVLDPDNPQYRMVIDEASLTIYDETDPLNPIPSVSLTPLGIDAASITFGSARGGHNLIQNSSFELGDFGTTSIITSVWTASADWTATRQGSDTNLTTGAGAITMTAT